MLRNSDCKEARMQALVLAKRPSVKHLQRACGLAYKQLFHSLKETLCPLLWLLSQNTCDCTGAR